MELPEDLITIEGGYFDPATHAYYDHGGQWVPSVTQILSLCGMSDYSMVPHEVLERKRDLGSRVHAHCAVIDKFGSERLGEVLAEDRPYVDAYLRFMDEMGFIPQASKVEQPMVISVYGMEYGVTPDVFGTLDGLPSVIERKCANAPKRAWKIQTAFQDMAFIKPFCGSLQRLALMLRGDGSFRLDRHLDYKKDVSLALACLTVVWARLDSGEPVWEKV